jgi:hypothetical protein
MPSENCAGFSNVARSITRAGSKTARSASASTAFGLPLAGVSFDTLEKVLRADVKTAQNSSLKEPHLRLLPCFDPWVLGHADKNQLVDARHYKRIFRSAAWVAPVVLLNGRAAGVWSHKRQGKHLAVTVEPFEKFSKAVRSLIEAEAARLGEFLELPARVVIDASRAA